MKAQAVLGATGRFAASAYSNRTATGQAGMPNSAPEGTSLLRPCDGFIQRIPFYLGKTRLGNHLRPIRLQCRQLGCRTLSVKFAGRSTGQGKPSRRVGPGLADPGAS